MNEMLTLQESIRSVLGELEKQKYSKDTIQSHSAIYNSIQKFMEANKITTFNEKVCVDFVFYRTEYKIEGFYGSTGNRKVNSVMKPLQVLLDFIQTGTVKFKVRPKVPTFQSPEQFEEEYSAFQEELIYREYARATVISNTEKVENFLRFLETNKVDSSKLINTKHFTIYLSAYKNSKPRYVSAIIQVLRNYLVFIYDHGFIDEDISKFLPKVRIARNAFIPYSWKTEDVIKLLGAVDRIEVIQKEKEIMQSCFSQYALACASAIFED